jgi:hypothetical protein
VIGGDALGAADGIADPGKLGTGVQVAPPDVAGVGAGPVVDAGAVPVDVGVGRGVEAGGSRVGFGVGFGVGLGVGFGVGLGAATGPIVTDPASRLASLLPRARAFRTILWVPFGNVPDHAKVTPLRQSPPGCRDIGYVDAPMMAATVPAGIPIRFW